MYLKYKISKTTARKTLNRLEKSSIVYSSKPILFKEGYAYSCKSDPYFFVNSLNKKPLLYAAYKVIDKESVISEYDLYKLCSLVDLKKTKYYNKQKVKKDLTFFFPELKIIDVENIKFWQKNNLNYSDKIKFLIDRQKFNARMIPLVKSYCSRLGLIYKDCRYIDEETPFLGIKTRNIYFDAIGYSPIGNDNVNVKTICLFEFCIDSYSDDKLDGFISRCSKIRNSAKKKQRIIPIFITSNLDIVKRKSKLEKMNIIILELENIFGSKIRKFLEMINSKSNLIETSNIIKIVEETGHAKQLTNFIPYVFEIIVNNIISVLLGAKYEQTNFNEIKIENQKKEFDGRFENEKEILFVETKSFESTVPWNDPVGNKDKNSYGKYFFINKYKFLKEWVCKNNINKDIKLLFVSANGYRDFDEHKNEIESSTINSFFKKSYLTINDLLNMMHQKQIPTKELKKWLNEYYIRKDKQ